jgi:ligand-binding sensor domain-containing protein
MKNTFRVDGFIRFFFVMFCVLSSSKPLNAQWIQTNVPNNSIYEILVSNTDLFVATNSGIFLSTNNGTSWDAVNSGLTTTTVTSLVKFGKNLFAGTFDKGVFLSTNNGQSWSAAGSGLPNYMVSSLVVSGTNLFAGTIRGGVFLSTNNGISWTAANTGLTSSVVNALAVSDSNIFAGTPLPGVYISTNNGTSWTEVNSGLTNGWVYALAVFGKNIFAGTAGGGVFLSTNNGANWTPVNSGLTGQALKVGAFAAFDTNIFVGTYAGVFLSINNGITWTSVNNGFPNNYVSSFALLGSYLFAGTGGGGVWRRTLSELLSVEADNKSELPATFSLSQNYPNPFNPSTTISFSLPSKSFVSLKVFNILGREVADIVSEEMSPGTYSRQWKAGNLSSGIYFYQLQAGLFTETRKLILLR